MSGALTLVDTLKRALKTRGVTYKTLAQQWKLSEASVKRIMSSGDVSLDRIERACTLMQMSFADLIKLAPFDLETTDQTILPEHEEAFAKEPRLYHFWVLLNDGNTVKQIEKKYVLGKLETQKLLLKLDHLKLIELHPHQRVKILNPHRTLLRKDGPLGKVILQQAKDSFLNHPFRGQLGEHLRFGLSSLNPLSATRYKAKIDKILHEMRAESEVEGPQTESIEYGLLIAFRPWTSPLFQALEKRK